MQLKVLDTEIWPLLDSIDGVYVICVELYWRLYLSPNYTSKKITIASGDSVCRVGALLNVPTTFWDQAGKLNYLVVEK